jgi:hypothetical protein
MSELTTMLSETFDIDKEEGSQDFEPLPRGNYVASLKDAKVGALKSGRGQAVELTWEIEGNQKYAGRLVFDRAIVQHDSAEAMRIGRQKLKDICDACEAKGALTDLKVLLSRPCMLYLVIEQDQNGEYPPKNRVSRVRPIAKPNVAIGNGAARPVKPEFNDDIPNF